MKHTLTIGAVKLRRHYNKSGQTQTEIGARIGRSQSHVCRLLNGTVLPSSADEFGRLNDLCGAKLHDWTKAFRGVAPPLRESTRRAA